MLRRRMWSSGTLESSPKIVIRSLIEGAAGAAPFLFRGGDLACIMRNVVVNGKGGHFASKKS